MAELNLAIHGKTYAITCDDGEEPRVRELAKYIDARMREIGSAGAATNEPHLLVLTALVLADEVFDLRANLQARDHAERARLRDERESAASAPAAPPIDPEDERQIVDAINTLAARIDSVADRLLRI